ncbi:energy transducer TonB [Alcaligenaceae bacterium LF4-65]|uniref:Energy transducer TonB n=1 Tax=Zwartia hollandica TaxID=324606 RepID=A0A953N9L6_9BURK|nr:energy transducer TonB [Zwartia hollandica]MBZ1350754.1 energy transducer TonB [Zwartia hollandica]
MSDKTSQSGTRSTLLDQEASGIYAPVRLTQPIPRQRYGWHAAIIVLAHLALLAVFLMRLDFLSGGTVPSKSETLDIIVVDLSSESDTTPPAAPVAESSVTSPPPPTSLEPPTEAQPTREPATIPVEPATQPVVEAPLVTKEVPLTAPAESPVRPEPPTPAPKPVATAVNKNIAAPSSSATTSAPQQPAAGVNRDSDLQATPPRLDPAYLHNPAPNYPALSKRNRESGTVLLLVNVDPEGNALAVTLHKSSGYERLDQAAIQAVTRWRFVPGMRGQTAISATVIVPISFKQP